LVVKIDAIGDYILFRNYLQVLKEFEKYRNYQIDLLGNLRFQELAIEYDKQYINEFYFIDEQDLYYKPLSVFKVGYRLFKRKYELVIQPTYSRTLMGNGLAGLAAGKEIIAFRSDSEHHPKYKKYTDPLYTKLLSLPTEIFHEYEKNHNFFEQILDQKLPLKAPSLPIEKSGERGIIVFPGSSFNKRNWEKEKFLEVIIFLLICIK